MTTTLTDDQKARVTAWVQEGLSLAQIQTRIAEEFGTRLTFLEVKLLVGDLNLVPKDREPEGGNPTAGSDPARPGAGTPGLAPDPQQDTAGSGKVAVTVDQITRPGALISGSVTFSDNRKATWYLDQLGRLGIAADDPAYRPPPGDIPEFQRALDRELQRHGY